MTAKKVHIKTYGCQMNAYDSVRMADILKPLGYTESPDYTDVDLVILNTCHIREKAAEKVYSDLGRILKQTNKRKAKTGQKTMIAVGGCVAQAEGEEVMNRAPFVDMVFGPQSYHRLPELIVKAERKQGRVVELDFPAVEKFDALPTKTNQGPAAFLAVQEGCDKFCTFCVVPYTRGAEYSRNAADVLDEAKRLVDGGAKEVMLLGQNVNAYHGLAPSPPRQRGGRDAAGIEGGVSHQQMPTTHPPLGSFAASPPPPAGGAKGSWSLAELIDALAQINGLERIRYITSHPNDMTQDLLDIHGTEPKLMPYLHLPIQAGSDRILHKMNRKHTAEFYLDILTRLRKVRPDIAFSGDFIVGFPGETDQDFDATMQLVSEVQYASAYSFKYSPRPGTPAAIDPDQVAEEVKKERLVRLQALLGQQQEAFNQSCIGRTMPVLFDRPGKQPGQMIGRSPYLQSVHVDNATQHMGEIVEVNITQATQVSLGGVML